MYIYIWVCLKIVYPYTQWFCWSLSLLNGYNWGYTPFSDIPIYIMYIYMHNGKCPSDTGCFRRGFPVHGLWHSMIPNILGFTPNRITNQQGSWLYWWLFISWILAESIPKDDHHLIILPIWTWGTECTAGLMALGDLRVTQSSQRDRSGRNQEELTWEAGIVLKGLDTVYDYLAF